MIWDSGPWKDQLIKLANQMERRKASKRWSPRSDFLIEQELFLGFYSIRKLLESQKLSAEVEQCGYPVSTFPMKEAPSIINWHQLERLFDLGASKVQTLPLTKISNLFIHSYIFIPSFTNERQLEGVFFTSDLGIKKDKLLYKINIDELISIFNYVGSDDVIFERQTRNPKTGDFEGVRIRGSFDSNAVPGDLVNLTMPMIQALSSGG